MQHAQFNYDTQNLDPFLKWAGGKRWLIKSDIEYMPEKFNRYIEPFLGSGAVFFSIRNKNCILSDLNHELIITYNAIKNDWKKVEKTLKTHSYNHSDEYYYKIRSSKPLKEHTIAARFIYLNRTCWNGLYRVNLKGEFNVPRGTKNSVLLDTDHFEHVSNKLSKCKILCQDFEDTIIKAREGDFIFVDPPYTVKHNLNGFVKYNEKIFSWNDQIRLRDALLDASNRGVMVTVTNANHESVKKLYEKYGDINPVERASVLAANPVYRNKTTEIIIKMGW